MAQQDHESIVRGFYESCNNQDLDRASGYLAADCEWRNMATGEIARGPEGFKRDCQNWSTAFPDGRGEITNTVCSGEWCTVEAVVRGTHTGTLNGPTGPVQKTGKKVEFHCCDVLQLRNGKIWRAHTYFDMLSMLQQLGLMPQARQAGQ